MGKWYHQCHCRKDRNPSPAARCREHPIRSGECPVFSCLKNSIPDLPGGSILEIHFETTGSGISCRADQYVLNTGKYTLRKGIVLHVPEVHVGQWLQHIRSQRTLNSKERCLVGDVVHLHIPFVLLPDPVPILFDVRSIYDEHIRLLIDPIHEQVVDNSSPIIREATVLHFPVEQLGGIIAGYFWIRSSAWGPFRMNSPMWLTSNTPTTVAHCFVLGIDPFVRDRHQVAGERNHFSAKTNVQVVECNVFEIGGDFHGLFSFSKAGSRQ